MITQMRVKGLIFDPYNNAYIVVLRDEENSDMLPIWVGKSEASAIGLALRECHRSASHDARFDEIVFGNIRCENHQRGHYRLE